MATTWPYPQYIHNDERGHVMCGRTPRAYGTSVSILNHPLFLDISLFLVSSLSNHSFINHVLYLITSAPNNIRYVWLTLVQLNYIIIIWLLNIYSQSLLLICNKHANLQHFYHQFICLRNTNENYPSCYYSFSVTANYVGFISVIMIMIILK